MNPEVWGPPAWTFLHSVTLAYPDNPSDIDKYNYENFFNVLQPILPCAKCSYNYMKHLQEDPITNHLDSKKSLVNWMESLLPEVMQYGRRGLREALMMRRNRASIIDFVSSQILLLHSNSVYKHHL